MAGVFVSPLRRAPAADVLGAPSDTAELANAIRVDPNASFERGLRQSASGISAGAFADEALKAEQRGDREGFLRNKAIFEGLQQEAQQFAPRVQRFEQINGLRDAIDFGAGALGQAVPSAIPSLAGGLVGGLVAGPAGAVVGASIPGYYMNRGEQIASQYQDPAIAALPAEQRGQEATRYGIMAGALDALAPASAASRLLRPSLGNYVRNLGKETLIEGATEGGQTLLGQNALARLNPNRDTSDDRSELYNAIIAGGIGGAGMSAASSAVTAAPRALLAGAGRTADAVGGAAGTVGGVLGNAAGAAGDTATGVTRSLLDMFKGKPRAPIDLSGSTAEVAEQMKQGAGNPISLDDLAAHSDDAFNDAQARVSSIFERRGEKPSMQFMVGDDDRDIARELVASNIDRSRLTKASEPQFVEAMGTLLAAMKGKGLTAEDLHDLGSSDLFLHTTNRVKMLEDVARAANLPQGALTEVRSAEADLDNRNSALYRTLMDNPRLQTGEERRAVATMIDMVANGTDVGRQRGRLQGEGREEQIYNALTQAFPTQAGQSKLAQLISQYAERRRSAMRASGQQVLADRGESQQDAELRQRFNDNPGGSDATRQEFNDPTLASVTEQDGSDEFVFASDQYRRPFTGKVDLRALRAQGRIGSNAAGTGRDIVRSNMLEYVNANNERVSATGKGKQIDPEEEVGRIHSDMIRQNQQAAEKLGKAGLSPTERGQIKKAMQERELLGQFIEEAIYTPSLADKKTGLPSRKAFEKALELMPVLKRQQPSGEGALAQDEDLANSRWAKADLGDTDDTRLVFRDEKTRKTLNLNAIKLRNAWKQREVKGAVSDMTTAEFELARFHDAVASVMGRGYTLARLSSTGTVLGKAQEDKLAPGQPNQNIPSSLNIGKVGGKMTTYGELVAAAKADKTKRQSAELGKDNNTQYHPLEAQIAEESPEATRSERIQAIEDYAAQGPDERTEVLEGRDETLQAIRQAAQAAWRKASELPYERREVRRASINKRRDNLLAIYNKMFDDIRALAQGDDREGAIDTNFQMGETLRKQDAPGVRTVEPDTGESIQLVQDTARPGTGPQGIAPNVGEYGKLPDYKPGQKTMTYAGIGSRETPPEILAQMQKFAARLRELGYTLLSGGAKGADSAFAAGAKGQARIFRASDATPRTRQIAAQIHPAPERLSPIAMNLMARNTFQVFGAELDTPVDFVLVWTPDGAETAAQRGYNTGGSGQAIMLAAGKGVPVINLRNPNAAERIKKILDAKPDESGAPSARERLEATRPAVPSSAFDRMRQQAAEAGAVVGESTAPVKEDATAGMSRRVSIPAQDTAKLQTASAAQERANPAPADQEPLDLGLPAVSDKERSDAARARELEQARLAEDDARRNNAPAGEQLELERARPPKQLPPAPVRQKRGQQGETKFNLQLPAPQPSGRGLAVQPGPQSPLLLGYSGLTADQQKEIIDGLVKRLGKNVKVLIEKLAGGVSGSYTRNEKIGNALYADVVRLSIQLGMDAARNVAAHEALHGLFGRLREAGASSAKLSAAAVLERVAMTPAVQKQLKALLAKHPAALKQLEDPEESAAYMYQFWNAGELKVVPPAAQDWMSKIRDMIRRVLKLATEEEKAAALMTAFDEGRFSNRVTVDAVLRDLREKTFREKLQQGEVTRYLVDIADKLFMSATDRLRATNVPALRDLARLFHVETDNEGGRLGFLQRRTLHQNKMANRINNILRNKSETVKTEALYALQTQRPATSKEAQTLVDDIRVFFDSAHTYLTSMGVKTLSRKLMLGSDGIEKEQLIYEPLRKVKDYFPRVWDSEQILNNEKEFRELLTKYLLADGVSKMDINVMVDGIVRSLTTEDTVAMNDNAAYTPFMEASNSRALTFINAKNAAQFQKFQAQDLSYIMSRYAFAAAHRGAYAKIFDNSGEVIEAALDKAVKQGATPADIALARQSASALLGTMGKDIDPKLRTVMNNVIAYENIVLLPFSLINNLMDVVGIAARSGELTDAWEALKTGLAGVLAAARGLQPGEMEKLAAEIGLIDDEVLAGSYGFSHEGNHVTGFAKSVQDRFFKLNGMYAWNKSMRIAAMRAGHRFMIERGIKAADGDETSLRMLKELNLEMGDMMLINRKGQPGLTLAFTVADGLTPKQANKMQEAMMRFVDGAAIRPNAAHRPIWGSDPRFMLIFHLKQFTYSFQNVVKRYVEKEAAHENYAPTAAMLAYVPVGLALGLAKSVISGRPIDTSLSGMLALAVKSATLGTATFGADALTDLNRNQIPGASFIGPAAGHAVQAAQTLAGSPNDSIADLGLRSAPLGPALRATVFRGE